MEESQVAERVRMLERGVWGVLATPFTPGATDIDESSLQREVRLYEDARATGLTVLGVFGEAAQLSEAEQQRVLDVVCRAPGDLPIVVGISARSLDQAIAEGRRAVETVGDRLHGLLVLIPSPDPDALTTHLTRIHAETGAGIVVQDYPLVTGVRISTDALVVAINRCDFVVGVKSEAPPTPPAILQLTAETSVPVFGGLGGVGLLDELAAGSAGAMTGFSHPEGLVAAVSAWGRGGFQAAREAFLPWLPLANFESQAGIALSIRKELLRARGVLTCADVRPPALRMPPSLLPLLQEHVVAVAPMAG
jgi:4-hydroxy-tetrahydrodipicolinate synthase